LFFHGAGVLAGLGAAALARSSKPVSDPLDVWLSGGLFLDDGEPINALKWWVEQKQSGNSHDGLCQMALDILSCPGNISFKLFIIVRANTDLFSKFMYT
jgi:hypothetical protein